MKDIKKSRLINVLIPFGIAFFITCAVFTFLTTTHKTVNILTPIFLFCQTILGAIIIFLSIRITSRATHLFIGMILFFYGILLFLVNYVFSTGIKEWWPLFGVLAGILLFVSGRYKYAKMKFGYVIPSFALIGMGLWYSFFSFGIIKRSFIDVVSDLGGIFLVLIAAALVVFFLVQQRHKKLVITDEDNGTFSDEDDDIIKHED